MPFLPARAELRSMLSLAVPIAAMQLGLMAFGVVDTLFMGRLGPEAVSGVGLGSSYFFSLMLFGFGSLLGIDSLSSRAYGAGRSEESAAIYAHALLLAVLIGIPLFVAMSQAGRFFDFVGVDPTISQVSVEYLKTLRWMCFSFLIFNASRQYLQSLSITRPLLAAVVLGNISNAGLNYALILGKFGAPAMGTKGCALASVVSSILMALISLFAAVQVASRSSSLRVGFRRDIFSDLLRLGLPAGLQMFTEISMFALTSALMGRFGAIPAAGHQITMNLVSVTFMVPFGVSFAAAVRVASALGRGDGEGALAAGRAAFFIGVGFMAVMAILFWSVPAFFIGLYSSEPEVVRWGALFLLVGGLFQIFDGAQIVLNGMIRGLGETRIQFAAHLFGFGLVGLPLGFWLAFKNGTGPVGLWYGLLTGLVLSAGALGLAWLRLSAAARGRATSFSVPGPALP